MSRRAWSCGVVLALCWLPFVVTADAATGAEPDPPTREEQASPPTSADQAEISFHTLRRTPDGDELFVGAVTIVYGDARIQADRITRHEGRYLEAEGNVLVAWAGNRIFGSRMSYDLETQTGSIWDAIGQVENDYLFWARRVEKVGDKTLHLTSATVTTCTQPVPYWSFSVSSATITINGYARMWNVRLRGGPVPIIYLPYMVWPVKEDRAAGLLLPEFQTTDRRGRAIEEKLFIPLGRSADVTLLGRYYTLAGFGWGGTARLVPNRNGAASVSGFFINDKTTGRSRYSTTYRQTQEFRNGFRLVADVNAVSDFQYFSDFERDLSLVSSPTILARVEMSRNGPWASMNVRELRREQLFADGSSLIQRTLPEIEWRGRSRRLGSTPFYLNYESSLAWIQQYEKLSPLSTKAPLNADYFRGDVFPEISLPWSPVPWLDVTPRVSYRLTHYTQQQRIATDGSKLIFDDTLDRGLFGAGIDIVGPKFYHIYETPDDPFSKRYKHTVETQVSYGYREAFDDLDQVILYDEIDRFSGSGNQASYAVVQRLFAQRPQARVMPPTSLLESIVMPDGSKSAAPDDDEQQDEEPLPEADAPVEPVEIATFEVRQSRSFDRDLSVADLDGDGVQESASPYSNINILGRFNPNRYTSLDVQGNYHILYGSLQDVTISGSIRGTLAALRFSMVYRNGLGVTQTGTTTDGSGATVPVFSGIPDTTQLRLTTGFNLLDGRLRLGVDGTYDATPPAGQRHVPDYRWSFQYRTQCCTIRVEKLSRAFSSLQDRNDFYFRVDLTGLGKILDVTY